MASWKWLLAGAVGLVVCVAALVVRSSFTVWPISATCDVDNEISPRERPAIEQTALRFAQSVMGGQIQNAYAMLAPETQTTVSPEQLAMAAKQLDLPDGLPPPRVARAYFVEVNLGSGGGSAYPCGPADALNRTGTIPIGPEHKQARVVTEATSSSGRAAFTIWMHRDQGRWLVGGFTYAGKRTGDSLAKGRTTVAP